MGSDFIRDCGPGDDYCLNEVKAYREDCIPSTSVVTVGNETNHIRMRVVVRNEGGECVITEEILEDSDSGLGPYDLTGYNVSCGLSPEEFEAYGPQACNGSLFDYVVNQEGEGPGGDAGDGGTAPEEGEKLFCSEYDYECKETRAEHVSNCVDVVAESTEVITYEEDDIMFWTVYLDVEKKPSGCELYYRVINAVNLPPDIPYDVIGMDMQCWVPESELPIPGIYLAACEGDLKEYFMFIYPED
jgi:hypothetical protein